MSHLTDAAYDATTATRAASQAVHDHAHTALDYALALHQLHYTTSALTQLLTRLHGRVRAADPTTMTTAVAKVVDGLLAEDVRTAETAARRLVTTLNICAADFDWIQAATRPRQPALAL